MASAALRDQQALLRSVGLNDNFASKSLSVLAKLGAEGKFAGNMRRDLISRLGDPAVPEPAVVSCPMFISKPSPGEQPLQNIDVSIFLPHEMFAYLHAEARTDFEKNCGHIGNSSFRVLDNLAGKKRPAASRTSYVVPQRMEG